MVVTQKGEQDRGGRVRKVQRQPVDASKLSRPPSNLRLGDASRRAASADRNG
jgi:hypothetical protein